MTGSSRHYSSRKRSVSPPNRRDPSYEQSRDRVGYRGGRESNRAVEYKKRHYDRDERPRSGGEPTFSSSSEVKTPPGFPSEYHWSRGDWLCPSPGCEGYVTEAKFRNCIQCGRSQPHFVTLMALARNERYRTDVCENAACAMRACERVHALIELRDYGTSRVYKKSSNSSPPMIPPSLTGPEIDAFCARWNLQEPAVSVLHRLPGPLGDLVNRQFMVTNSEIPETQQLMKCLADIIRPRTVQVGYTQFPDLLKQILRVYSGPIGLACSSHGHVAIALEKEVMQLRVKEFSNEDLGLLVFTLSFSGLCVVHASADLENLLSAFPKLYMDMWDRVRVVDNPSEIIYVAADAFEAAVDRATQAKIDALSNPAPLLPTPEQ